MNVVDIEDGDCDQDIFVIKQIKPVNKLTLQQALIIKYNVLSSRNSKNIKNKRKCKRRESNSKSSAAKSKIGPLVVSEPKTKTRTLPKADCAVKKTIIKSDETTSSKVMQNNNSDYVEKQGQNTPEKRKGPLKSDITKKSRSSFISSDLSETSGNCTDLKAENHNVSSNIGKKRKKPELTETKQNEEEPPIKVPKGPEGNKIATIKESSKEFFLKDITVKTEIKQELDTENAFFENKVKSKECIDGCSNILLNNGFQRSFIDAVNVFEVQDEEIFKSNSELLCFLLKKIICNETKKQIYLEQQSQKTGRVVEKLLSETDCEILEKFFNLNENAAQVFVRMLGRKKNWHRVSNINCSDISDNLEHEFNILHKENFVDVNIEDEDIKTQLKLFKKSEVMEMCKAFNVPVKFCNNSFTKEILIDTLIKDSKRQKSICDMFKTKKSANYRLDLLKSKIKSSLGMCIKLSDIAFQTFYKIFLLHSFPHYTEEEDSRFSNELHMSLQVYKNFIRFPNYKLSPTVVFETRGDFEEYKKALFLFNSCKLAITDKNHDEFIVICNKAKEEFMRLLKNNEYQKRFLNLKSFLRKFSAGTVYARILSEYCTTFKKKSSNLDKIRTAQLLLGQNLFLVRKRGEWYETLVKALENEKNCKSSVEFIIKALKDPHVSEVQKLTLQLRGQSILKKKDSGFIDVTLREELGDMCTVSISEPPSIEIKGKVLSVDNATSKKSVYVQDCKYGKMYISVEERAILHYKSNGFPKGYHAEGFIVQSIYCLLFYDIIYATSVEGVFQSPYQEAPLDFYSASFYDNRKEEIDLLLGDMLNWNDQEIETKIMHVYNKNCKTTCLIKWDDQFTPDMFCEIIKCITMPTLILIFQRFIRNFRVYRSGFPDLTLWNPQTKKCKFVEVKSPNDRLSVAQRIWLDYLRIIGLDCEVCNVKNFSGKNIE